ncbi:YDG/SRA domain-containing protein [Apiospora arundinis]
MVNQLKRKRSGSPLVATKGRLVGDENGKSSQEQYTRAAVRAKLAGKSSRVDSQADTKKEPAASQQETSGFAPEADGLADTEKVTAADGQDDTKKPTMHDSNGEGIINILDIPTAPQDCIKSMRKEHLGIKNFAVKSKKKEEVPTSDPEDMRRLSRFTPYLNFLEFRLDMTRRVFKESKVAETLALMNRPGFFFPPDIAERAARLIARWEDEDWSEDLPEVQEEISTSSTNGTASNNANEEAAAVEIRVPSARDPLFGTNGIMNGVIATRNPAGRKVHMLNPLLPHRSSKEFGHNGLQVGQWFPMRLVALHHGAHGASQAGIYGSINDGAYSIVAGNSIYHYLDRDEGTTLYYSAPHAHENKNPKEVAAPSNGTLALRASVSSTRPVRVLRAAGGGTNTWLPQYGIRYDGLYQVTEIRQTKNANGGLYEQFKLVRLPENVNGQESLENIICNSPSTEQIAAYRSLNNLG